VTLRLLKACNLLILAPLRECYGNGKPAPGPAPFRFLSLSQGGVGLDVNLLPILSVRGEMRDFYSGAHQLNVDSGKSRQHNYFVGGGVVMLF
jgi:hypothetical protein